MKFARIDLHDGQVKQIVGSTLTDNITADGPTSNNAVDNTNDNDNNNNDHVILATNFTTTKPASDFAELYYKDLLYGGHVIMLGPGNIDAAKCALQAVPRDFLQIGGGITSSNAIEWIEVYGASHVIITSFVFDNGQIRYDRLNELVQLIGRKRLILDLSCRKKKPNNDDNNNDDDDDLYYVVTDRWQKYTNVPVNAETLQQLSQYCDEFLVHGVEVEGKQCGILQDLVVFDGQYSPIPVTYAGGVRSIEDLELVHTLGNGRVDCTVGSALDIFGGTLSYHDVVTWHKQKNPA